MTAADNRRIAALASDRAVHGAFRWLYLHSPQLLRWQMEMLAIPAPPFQEAERAQWFLAQFLNFHLHNPHVDTEGNVLAELQAANSTDDSPVILISAHLDTVFPSGTDCTPHLDDPREQGEGIIHGPGACDNGAGLTALLALAAALKHAEFTPATTILFCANVGEEGPGDLRGMRHLFSDASPYASRIRAAIALEGAGSSSVVDRALGSRRLRVEITGPGGHSWADAGLPNPINALAAALTELTNLALPASPRTTFNCGTISGGTSVNSIPSSATSDLDLRSTSTKELDNLEHLVLSTLSKCVKAEARRSRTRDGFRQRDALRITVRRIGNRTAGHLAPDSALAISLRAVDRHLSLKTESRIGSTDANHPLSLGIPALAIGAGGTGGGIHTPEEWYDPTGRELALRRILLLLLDTCANYAKESSASAKQSGDTMHSAISGSDDTLDSST